MRCLIGAGAVLDIASRPNSSPASRPRAIVQAGMTRPGTGVDAIGGLMARWFREAARVRTDRR